MEKKGIAAESSFLTGLTPEELHFIALLQRIPETRWADVIARMDARIAQKNGGAQA